MFRPFMRSSSGRVIYKENTAGCITSKLLHTRSGDGIFCSVDRWQKCTVHARGVGVRAVSSRRIHEHRNLADLSLCVCVCVCARARARP